MSRFVPLIKPLKSREATQSPGAPTRLEIWMDFWTERARQERKKLSKTLVNEKNLKPVTLGMRKPTSSQSAPRLGFGKFILPCCAPAVEATPSCSTFSSSSKSQTIYTWSHGKYIYDAQRRRQFD